MQLQTGGVVDVQMHLLHEKLKNWSVIKLQISLKIIIIALHSKYVTCQKKRKPSSGELVFKKRKISTEDFMSEMCNMWQKVLAPIPSTFPLEGS